MPPDIPDKVYFKIGEVAAIVGVEPHVLRFWESEFPQVKPIRTGSKQRLYRKQDLDAFLEIKHLLYTEQYTVAGAKKQLNQPVKTRPAAPSLSENSLISQIKHGLNEIKKLLDDGRPVKKRERNPLQGRLPFDGE